MHVKRDLNRDEIIIGRFCVIVFHREAYVHRRIHIQVDW